MLLGSMGFVPESSTANLNAIPRFSTHPNLELIPTHLELF